MATIENILNAREEVKKVESQENIINYLLDLIVKTRQHHDIALGASPRAAVVWLQTSKAKAWLSGRDYVTPDDIKNIAFPLLRHRLILNPEAQLEGVNSQAVIESILKQVAVPR